MQGVNTVFSLLTSKRPKIKTWIFEKLQDPKRDILTYKYIA